MGTQMNATGLIINPLAGLDGTYAAQTAGMTAGYNTALGGQSIPSAAVNQFSQHLNASLS